MPCFPTQFYTTWSVHPPPCYFYHHHCCHNFATNAVSTRTTTTTKARCPWQHQNDVSFCFSPTPPALPLALMVQLSVRNALSNPMPCWDTQGRVNSFAVNNLGRKTSIATFMLVNGKPTSTLGNILKTLDTPLEMLLVLLAIRRIPRHPALLLKDQLPRKWSRHPRTVRIHQLQPWNMMRN